jgi:hypothetical protein
VAAALEALQNGIVAAAGKMRRKSRRVVIGTAFLLKLCRILDAPGPHRK